MKKQQRLRSNKEDGLYSVRWRVKRGREIETRRQDEAKKYGATNEENAEHRPQWCMPMQQFRDQALWIGLANSGLLSLVGRVPKKREFYGLTPEIRGPAPDACLKLANRRVPLE
jgi:hypothetical protein